MRLSDKVKGLIIFLVCGPCATIAWFIPDIANDARFLATIFLGIEAAFGLFIYIKEAMKLKN